MLVKSLPMVGRLSGSLCRLRAIVTLSVCIASCAVAGGEPKTYYHSFSFDVRSDAKSYGHPEVDVLDYAYGDSEAPRTRPSKVAREMSSVFNSAGTAGVMPRGEYLYVKWRVMATGQVFEDRVDLRSRLPADIGNYGIRFVIDDSQLYVYAFPPYETKDVFGRVEVRGGHEVVPPPGQTIRDVPANRQHQIYPDIAK